MKLKNIRLKKGVDLQESQGEISEWDSRRTSIMKQEAKTGLLFWPWDGSRVKFWEDTCCGESPCV